MPVRLGCLCRNQTQSDAPSPSHTRIALRDVTASFMRMRRQARSHDPPSYSKHAGTPSSASSIRPRKDKPSAQVNIESARLGFFARGKPSSERNSRPRPSRYRPGEAERLGACGHIHVEIHLQCPRKRLDVPPSSIPRLPLVMKEDVAFNARLSGGRFCP